MTSMTSPDVADRYPEDFERLSRHPDNGGAIRPSTRGEARLLLELREQGKLPPDIDRPPGPMRQGERAVAEPSLEVTRWPDDSRARDALERYLQGRRAGDLDLRLEAIGLDFRGADLSGMLLGSPWLEEAVLDGVRLAGADLVSGSLAGAWMTGADLSGCVLGKTQLDGCRARDASLRGARSWRASAYRADLGGVDLTGAHLNELGLTDADLRGAELSGAHLDRVSFDRTRLGGCSLSGAHGSVFGSIDIGTPQAPECLDGDEMIAWLRSQGAGELVEAKPVKRG